MAANRSNNRGGIQRARQIANQGQSPIQQAATNVGRTFTPAPPPAPDSYTANVLPPNKTTDNRAPVSPVKHGGPVGCGVPGSTDWGAAAARNRSERIKYQFTIPPIGVPKEPPILYANIEVQATDSYGEPAPVLTIGPCPNPVYVKDIPPPPPPPDPEKPVDPVKDIVDEIIEESEREIVKEIEVKQDPVRPPVVDTQDPVRPPAPITPTELVLEAQANCEKEIQTPTINIVNENNVNVDLTATAAATSSFGPVEIFVPEIVRGCTDPDAINYDPAALLDDGTCKFEPVVDDEPVDTGPPPPPPLDIPDTVIFVDSHGEPLFEVLKEEVTKTEQTEEDGFALLPDGEQVVFGGEPLVADIKLVNDVTRPALENSDIILSLEDDDIADRKNIREALGGELASDNKLASDEEVVIIGDREKLNKPIFRNDEGIIFLDEANTSKLKVSLRSRAFNFNQYKRTIDTSLSELVGKK